MRNPLPLVLLLGCTAAHQPPETSLQRGLDALVRREPKVPGAILAVSAPDLEFLGAAGAFSLEAEARALRPDDLFRVASVTKTFVAAAVLRLVERGELSLDDPISAHLSEPSLSALTTGGYDPDRITVQHLLTHTAGLFDYTEADAFYDTIDADPQHRWTREEQLRLAMSEGTPHGAPGARYVYGDTAYILAGELLERLTGQGLGPALRDTLDFAGLGLGDTFLESLEPPPEPAALERLSHPYLGRQDTRGWDPSWDLYGGGGLVSSAPDLLRFTRALVAGELLGDELQAELLTIPPQGEGAYFGIDGGPGINRFTLDDGTECWGGWGFFGTEAVHCPAIGLTWAATLNQSDPNDGEAITRLVLAAIGR